MKNQNPAHEVSVTVRGHAIVINGESNLHTRRVRVFTGPDDYVTSDAIDVTTRGDKLCITTAASGQETMNRVRQEPCVEMFLESESSMSVYKLVIGHHKGEVLIRAFSV